MAGFMKRGNVYQAVYYVGKKQKRVSLETTSLQVAKEKIRDLEKSLYRGGRQSPSHQDNHCQSGCQIR